MQINDTVKFLNHATNKAIEVMQDYQLAQQQNEWKTIGLMLLSAVAAGMLSVWLVMPKPMLPFTQDTLTTYINGGFIEQVWPKLPAKMRQSINDISQKEFNNPSPLPVEEPNNGHTNETTAGNNEESWWDYNTLNKK